MGPVLSVSTLLIDTNVIIDFLRGVREAESYINGFPEESILTVSVITVTELYAGVKGKNEKELLELFLAEYTVIPIDKTTAVRGGMIKNKYNPSHGTGLGDAVIAATALIRNAKLITLNLKHFPMVEIKEAPY